MEMDLVKDMIKDSPWVALAFYMLFKHFQLHGQTIEVMAAIRTLIENLECRGGKRNVDDDANEGTATSS